MKNIYTQKAGAFLFFCSLFLFSFNGLAQVGINTTDPTTMLDVNGALSLRESPTPLTLGTVNTNIGLGAIPYSLYRIIGPGANFSIDGITRVVDSDGQLLTLINTTGHTMTLKSNAAGDANKIVCPSNTDLTLTGVNSSVTLQYNSSLNKWIITGSSDLGGYGRNVYKEFGATNINTNSASFSDMAGMSITFTPKHSVVYVNFSASGTMDKGVNFDSNAYANFQLVRGSTPIAATTTLASAGTSNNSAFYITSFPFTETFENDSPTLSSWYLKEFESALSQKPWELRTGSSSGSELYTAHSPTQNLYFDGDRYLLEQQVTKAISPVMDLTVLNNPVLTFWRAHPKGSGLLDRQSELKVYYRVGYEDSWRQLVGGHYNTDIRVWTKTTLALPNASSSYQIAFEGIGSTNGHAVVVDDVTVSGTGGSSGGMLDTAWNAGFTMYPISVNPGELTTIKVQWLRDGNVPRELRNNITTEPDRSHRNITIID